MDFLAVWALRLGGQNPLEENGPPAGQLSVVVFLAMRVACKQPLSEEADAIFRMILSTTPGAEKPLRRAIFKLLQTLPLEHAMRLVEKNLSYAKLLAMPEKDRNKSMAWFE